MCERSFSCTAFWTMMGDYVHAPGTHFSSILGQQKTPKEGRNSNQNRGQLGYKYRYIYIFIYMYIYLSTGCRGFLRVLNFGGHTFLLRTCCIKITAFCTINAFFLGFYAGLYLCKITNIWTLQIVFTVCLMSFPNISSHLQGRWCPSLYPSLDFGAALVTGKVVMLKWHYPQRLGDGVERWRPSWELTDLFLTSRHFWRWLGGDFLFSTLFGEDSHFD